MSGSGCRRQAAWLVTVARNSGERNETAQKPLGVLRTNCPRHLSALWCRYRDRSCGGNAISKSARHVVRIRADTISRRLVRAHPLHGLLFRRSAGAASCHKMSRDDERRRDPRPAPAAAVRRAFGNMGRAHVQCGRRGLGPHVARAHEPFDLGWRTFRIHVRELRRLAADRRDLCSRRAAEKRQHHNDERLALQGVGRAPSLRPINVRVRRASYEKICLTGHLCPA